MREKVGGKLSDAAQDKPLFALLCIHLAPDMHVHAPVALCVCHLILTLPNPKS